MALILNKKTKAEDVGSNTKGDLVVYNGTTITSLPIGTNDQVLKADTATSTGIKWAAESGGYLPLTTKGDLVTRDGTTNIRLPVGTDTQILEADSTTASGLKWAAKPVGTMATTTKGDLITHNGTASNLLPVGINDYVLTADSTATNGIAWKSAPSGGGGSETIGTFTHTTSEFVNDLDLPNVINLWRPSNNVKVRLAAMMSAPNNTKRTIINNSINNSTIMILMDRSSSSGSGQQLVLPNGHISLTQGQSATFYYSTTSNQWLLSETTGTSIRGFTGACCPWYIRGGTNVTQTFTTNTSYYYQFRVHENLNISSPKITALNSNNFAGNLYFNIYTLDDSNSSASFALGEIKASFWIQGPGIVLSGLINLTNLSSLASRYIGPGIYILGFGLTGGSNYTINVPTASSYSQDLLFPYTGSLNFNTEYMGYTTTSTLGAAGSTINLTTNATNIGPPIIVF